MKTIRVVAAVIKAVNEAEVTMILQRKEDMENLRVAGNSRAARLKMVKHRRKR